MIIGLSTVTSLANDRVMPACSAQRLQSSPWKILTRERLSRRDFSFIKITLRHKVRLTLLADVAARSCAEAQLHEWDYFCGVCTTCVPRCAKSKITIAIFDLATVDSYRTLYLFFRSIFRILLDSKLPSSLARARVCTNIF